MKLNLLKFSTVLMLCLAILGCDPHGNSMTYASPTTSMFILSQPQTVWDRMAADFSFKTHHTNPRVQRFVEQLTREDSANLIRFSKQATPYLYHIVQMLEERGMPPELALLPMLESEYRATAVSNRGATGIWQIALMTGRLYGLKQDQWYDGRKDPNAATKAALAHLEYLYERFNHDWLLALAAYNCGDARVSNAIRANKKAGKPTDYWSLKLPQETQYYVPKFLALVYLIKNHRILDINLSAIPNAPHSQIVTFNKQLSLQQAANLAKIDVKELKLLNPGFRGNSTHPKGPHQLFIPVKNVATFNANYKALISNTVKLAKTTANTKSSLTKSTPNKAQESKQSNKLNNIYTVIKGDTLNLIAAKHRTTVTAIKRKNNLNSDIIRSGQKLAI